MLHESQEDLSISQISLKRVRDSAGKHTNLSAIYDWPDANSDEEDSDINQVRLL